MNENEHVNRREKEQKNVHHVVSSCKDECVIDLMRRAVEE